MSELEMAGGPLLGTIDFSPAPVGNIPPILWKAGPLRAEHLVRARRQRDRLTENKARPLQTVAQPVVAAVRGHLERASQRITGGKNGRLRFVIAWHLPR